MSLATIRRRVGSEQEWVLEKTIRRIFPSSDEKWLGQGGGSENGEK